MKALKINMPFEEAMTQDDADAIGDVLIAMVSKIQARYPIVEPEVALLVAIEMLRKMLFGFMKYEAEDAGIEIYQTDMSKLKDDEGSLQ